MVRFMDCYVAPLTSGVRTFTVAPEARVMMVRLWTVVRCNGLLCRPTDLGLTNVYRCARGWYNDVDLRHFTSLQSSRDDDDDDDGVLTMCLSFYNE